MRAKPVNFERGVDPKDAMGTGLWQNYEHGIYISLDEFKENGGILTHGREIYKLDAIALSKGNISYYLFAYWLRYDSNQEIDLMYGESFKSMMVSPNCYIKVPAKIRYI